MMLRKLNLFFEARGELLGEREYSQDHAAPYRMALIQKYLGGYHRMKYYLGFYYPKWKEEKKPAPVVEEPDPLEALSTAAKDTMNDEDTE